MSKAKTIQISEELHSFLTAQAVKKADTYDHIIKRILKQFVGVSLDTTDVLDTPKLARLEPAGSGKE